MSFSKYEELWENNRVALEKSFYWYKQELELGEGVSLHEVQDSNIYKEHPVMDLDTLLSSMAKLYLVFDSENDSLPKIEVNKDVEFASTNSTSIILVLKLISSWGLDLNKFLETTARMYGEAMYYRPEDVSLISTGILLSGLGWINSNPEEYEKTIESEYDNIKCRRVYGDDYQTKEDKYSIMGTILIDSTEKYNIFCGYLSESALYLDIVNKSGEPTIINKDAGVLCLISQSNFYGTSIEIDIWGTTFRLVGEPDVLRNKIIKIINA